MPGASARRSCAQMGEHVGHLERAADGLGALLDAWLGLLDVIEREKSEGDGNAGLERGELQPACRLARDIVEVRRVSSDDAAEGDDAGEAPGLRKGGGGNGSSKAPGTTMIVIASRRTPATSSSSSARSRRRDVTLPLKRETTSPTARRPPSGTPSSTAYPSGISRSPAACSSDGGTAIAVPLSASASDSEAPIGELAWLGGLWIRLGQLGRRKAQARARAPRSPPRAPALRSTMSRPCPWPSRRGLVAPPAASRPAPGSSTARGHSERTFSLESSMSVPVSSSRLMRRSLVRGRARGARPGGAAS